MTNETELLVASNVDKYTNNTCRIIRNEVEPYVLFCASDIGNIVGIKNIHKNNLLCNDKINYETITNGGKQIMTYITYIGLLKLLSNSRKISAYNFATAIGIDIKNISFACIEASSIVHIIKTFKGEEMIEQYKIDNYIVDLYFPKYKLAIECDEKQHNIIKDRDREEKIVSVLGCKFIRYKPFQKDFDLFNVLNEIFTHIKNIER
jgi:hypothetical protein